MRVVSSLTMSHATDSPRRALSRSSLAMASEEVSALQADAAASERALNERNREIRFMERKVPARECVCELYFTGHG
jgi:hypothetical protein